MGRGRARIAACRTENERGWRDGERGLCLEKRRGRDGAA